VSGSYIPHEPEANPSTERALQRSSSTKLGTFASQRSILVVSCHFIVDMRFLADIFQQAMGPTEAKESRLAYTHFDLNI
jgi:hypothetical protein